MKVFVILLISVATSICADDLVWESAELYPLVPHAYVYQNMPVPKSSITKHPNGDVKTDSAQEQSENTMLSNKQPSANPSDAQSQALDQDKEWGQKVGRDANEIARKENSLTDEGNRIQRRLMVIGGITVGTQVLLTLVQIWFIRIANEHAAEAVRAAKESVDVARDEMKIVNRAYLFVKE